MELRQRNVTVGFSKFYPVNPADLKEAESGRYSESDWHAHQFRWQQHQNGVLHLIRLGGIVNKNCSRRPPTQTNAT